jgi:hypothetical protein
MDMNTIDEPSVPREILVNITVITDQSWDNVAKIMRRIDDKCIKTSHRINIFYGKNMKMLQNVCIRKGFTVFRRSTSNETYNSDIKNVLDYTKFCIIFHNFTEYNTISSCTIELCKLNCIPYFIISEHTDSYYFNGEYIHSKKFKNCVKEIHLSPRNTIVSLDFNPFKISNPDPDTDPENSVEKFMENYDYLQELKKTNRTILIT